MIIHCAHCGRGLALNEIRTTGRKDKRTLNDYLPGISPTCGRKCTAILRKKGIAAINIREVRRRLRRVKNV